MGLLDRFLPRASGPSDDSLRKQLVDFVLNALQDGRGIHVEDALSGAATIVGERCIDAAGDFPLRDHDLPPGQRVFSTRVNELISADKGNVGEVPKDCIVGMLRGRLDPKLYLDGDFPSLAEVYAGYAERIGKVEDWGKVPLSVPEANHPIMPPLQFGYRARVQVDRILSPISEDKQRCLRIATESLADILNMVATAIDRRVALLLAIETINGMAKTASMTEKAMQQVREKS
jgi:hypothetical protein